MAVIKEITSLDEYLNNSKFIGIGTTAICYLMQDGNVIKVFRDTFNTRLLFERKDIFDHFVKLCDLGNESYIAPRELLVKDRKVIAYTYPYVKAKTLLFLSKKTKVRDTLRNYNRLINDTKEISNMNYKLYDTTNRNILFNDRFNIIDIDRGKFLNNNESKCYDLKKYNIRQIVDTYMRKLFGINNIDFYNFYNYYLDEQFRNVDWLDEKSVYDFFEELFSYINNPNPTIKEVRKHMLIRKEFNIYYKPF